MNLLKIFDLYGYDDYMRIDVLDARMLIERIGMSCLGRFSLIMLIMLCNFGWWLLFYSNSNNII